MHLVARLIAGGYVLLDTQFVTEHLRTFGAIEIPRPAYLSRLDAALRRQGDFMHLAAGRPVTGAEALAVIAAAAPARPR